MFTDWPIVTVILRKYQILNDTIQCVWFYYNVFWLVFLKSSISYAVFYKTILILLNYFLPYIFICIHYLYCYRSLNGARRKSTMVNHDLPWCFLKWDRYIFNVFIKYNKCDGLFLLLLCITEMQCFCHFCMEN